MLNKINKNKYWLKTIPNDSKRENIFRLKLSRLRLHRIRLSRLRPSSSPCFENLNYNNALLNYNNGLLALKFQILNSQQWSEAGGGGPTKLHTPLRVVKIFEKSLDLANFINFADLPQGGRGYRPHPTPLLANPGISKYINLFSTYRLMSI